LRSLYGPAPTSKMLDMPSRLPRSSLVNSQVGVLPRGEADRVQAQIWAQRLELPLLGPGEPRTVTDVELVLWVQGGEVSLCLTGPKAPGPLEVNFVSANVNRRVRQGLNQSLARACGLRSGKRPRILDITAGLGRDAYVLAALGSKVTMIERNPILSLLLELALEHVKGAQGPYKADPLRLDLHQGDAESFLTREDLQRPEVIYLDPMFPPRKKKALVKKEMQLLHVLLGEAEAGEAEALLLLALDVASQRVIVKRPRISPPLGGNRPHQSFTGRSHRYDLYVIPDKAPAL
jgi:16S rRNA (guanine1516-N2)-methyltransferase